MTKKKDSRKQKKAEKISALDDLAKNKLSAAQAESELVGSMVYKVLELEKDVATMKRQLSAVGLGARGERGEKGEKGEKGSTGSTGSWLPSWFRESP